uniref:Retrovirus-related Pol polyprotein from transposon TNT 1-94 n=1 Tax=Cajanus cajan TaxID=3821 RepID=A0A151SQ41_CAJCA|nr:Retrovirus-related Pol polyprotein from transposon TNT 1-94 [Cajanus cajan]KYP56859.1 Retrovirus-related Pol polyprotein from transposon TNT 1-94 [Cajanus cajan]
MRRKFAPIQVNLPNGSIVMAEYTSTVHISDTLTLDEVLYLPNFSYNLISLSKLMDTAKYEFRLANKKCFIHDSNLKMIGSGELVNGLFYLKMKKGIHESKAIAAIVASIPEEALWHFRLGHVSSSRIEGLKRIVPSIHSQNKEDICDICHFAKQKHISFPISISRATCIFDLVHMDIWGPFSVPSIHNNNIFLLS